MVPNNICAVFYPIEGHCAKFMSDKNKLSPFFISLRTMVWYSMEEFLYTEGIQLTAAHSGGRYSDLTQVRVIFVLKPISIHIWILKKKKKKLE